MKALQQAIKIKVGFAADIHKYTDKYVDTIKVIISSINPAELESLRSELAQISAITTELTETTAGSIESVIDVYEKFAKLRQLCGSVMQIFENTSYFQMALYRVSTVVANSVYSKRAAVQAAFADMNTKTIELDEAAFNEAIAGASQESFAEIALRTDKVNNFTIWLTRKAITGAVGERRRQLELIIENHKDKVLGSKRLDLGKYAGIQGTIMRYRLVPLEPSRPAADVLGELGINAWDDATVGIVLIDSRTPSPVEFDIRGLIDAEYVEREGLKNNPISGLNKKTIKRFATTNQLDRSTEPAAPLRVYNKESATFHVFETINGTLWRRLGFMGAPGPVAAANIRGLLRGLNSRPADYNSIQQEQILLRYTDPAARGLINSYLNSKFAVNTPGEIMNKVSQAHAAYFDTAVSRLTNARDFKEAITDQRKMMNAVIGALPPASTSAKGLILGDLNIAALAKADTATKRIIRELDRNFNARLLPDEVFKLPNRDDVILSVYKALMERTMTELTAGGAWDEFIRPIAEYFMDHKL